MLSVSRISLTGCAAIDRGIDVKAEPIVAARCDRNGDRRFAVECAPRQSRESLHHFSDAAARRPELRAEAAGEANNPYTCECENASTPKKANALPLVRP